MFAVIKTGGKQYRVAADDVITIEEARGRARGRPSTFDEVLMLTGADGVQVGRADTSPERRWATEIVDQTRGPKVIAFKKRRRKNSRRKRGHRQDHTLVRILRDRVRRTEKVTRSRAARRRRSSRPPRRRPSLLAEPAPAEPVAAGRARRAGGRGGRRADDGLRGGDPSWLTRIRRLFAQRARLAGQRLGVKKFGGEAVSRATSSCASAAPSSGRASTSAWARTTPCSPSSTARRPVPGGWAAGGAFRIGHSITQTE